MKEPPTRPATATAPYQKEPSAPAHAPGAGGTDATMALAPSDRRWATFALMLATAMQAADATIVNVALPHLEGNLGGGLELGSWVMTSYLCAAAVAVPMTGWLRRRLGPRLLYHGAIGLFVAASLLCALAPTGPALVFCRILQGAGGGVIPALTQAVLHDLYPRERHGRMLGIWGAVAMVGPILGPVLGGTITDIASWRWVFLINLPLGVVATWRMHRLLPNAETQSTVRFDLLGLLLLIAGVGALQLCLERSIVQSWTGSPELLIEAVVAAIALGVTAVRSSRSRASILRLDVFGDINFAVAAFFNFTTSGLLFTAIVFVPLLAQGPLGYPATIAGLTIVPRGVMMMLVVLAIGQFIDRMDYRIALATGSLLMAVGAGVVGTMRSGDDLVWIISGSTIQAIGAGMILMPLSTFAFMTLPPAMRTDAAGLYGLLRQIGCATGVALMTAVLQARITAHVAAAAAAAATSGGGAAAALRPELVNRATVHAYAECFRLLAIGAFIVAPAILLFRPPSGRRRVGGSRRGSVAERVRGL